MTTLIQQKSDNDCALAAIAMAAGKERWEDLWTPADLQAVIDSKGVGDYEPWLARAGFLRLEHYRTLYTYTGDNTVRDWLWRRRAILSINSLNTDGGSHAVYWDGSRVYDPQEGREGKLFHRLLNGCSFSGRFIIFA